MAQTSSRISATIALMMVTPRSVAGIGVDQSARHRGHRQARHVHPIAVGRRVAHRLRHRAEERRHALARHLLKDTTEIALDLRRGDAGLQPAEHLQPPERRLIEPRLIRTAGVHRAWQRQQPIERQRHDEIRRIGDDELHASEGGGRDADNRERRVVRTDHLADDRRVAAKAARPELLADRRHRRRVRLVVFRQTASVREWPARRAARENCPSPGTRSQSRRGRRTTRSPSSWGRWRRVR